MKRSFHPYRDTRWLIWCLGLIVWIALAIYFHERPEPVAGEVRFIRWLQSLPIDRIAGLANDLAYSPVAVTIGLACSLLLLQRRRLEDAFLVTLAVAIRPVNSIAKELVERPRPGQDQVAIMEHATGFAFPSGHAFGSALLCGALLIVVWRSGISTWKRRVAAGTLGLVILCCGLARCYVGAHWPTDVGGAWLIAALWLVLLARIAAFVRRSIGPLDHFS